MLPFAAGVKSETAITVDGLNLHAHLTSHTITHAAAASHASCNSPPSCQDNIAAARAAQDCNSTASSADKSPKPGAIRRRSRQAQASHNQPRPLQSTHCIVLNKEVSHLQLILRSPPPLHSFVYTPLRLCTARERVADLCAAGQVNSRQHQNPVLMRIDI